MPKKPEKSGRIVSLFKRKEPAQTKRQITSSSHASSADFGAQLPSFTSARAGDRQRTRKKYLDATKLLEASLKTYGEKWGLFDFPELNGEPETFEDSQFREKINAIMDAQKSKVNDQNAWAKCKHGLQCAYIAFSPFAKNFLTITKDVQVVFPLLAISYQ